MTTRLSPPFLPQKRTTFAAASEAATLTEWTGALDTNYARFQNWTNGIPTEGSTVVYNSGSVDSIYVSGTVPGIVAKVYIHEDYTGDIDWPASTQIQQLVMKKRLGTVALGQVHEAHVYNTSPQAGCLDIPTLGTNVRKGKLFVYGSRGTITNDLDATVQLPEFYILPSDGNAATVNAASQRPNPAKMGRRGKLSTAGGVLTNWGGELRLTSPTATSSATINVCSRGTVKIIDNLPEVTLNIWDGLFSFDECTQDGVDLAAVNLFSDDAIFKGQSTTDGLLVPFSGTMKYYGGKFSFEKGTTITIS